MNEDYEEQMKALEESYSNEVGVQAPFSNEYIQKKKEEKNTIEGIIKREIQENTDENIEKAFVYRDYNGKPLYRIIKQKEGQEYAVQSYQNGEYIYGMNGTQKVPYNIPQLNNSKDKVVFVVNGEDKADLLTELGFISTTAPFNSPKKWRKEFNFYLSNAKGVIILQDNKENSTKYVANTYRTIKEDIENVGIVGVIDISIKLEEYLDSETTIIDLRNQLKDDEKLKQMLNDLEQRMII